VAAAQVANIPAPPQDGLGSLRPPDGFPWAYCPDLKAGKVLKYKMNDQDAQMPGQPAQDMPAG